MSGISNISQGAIVLASLILVAIGALSISVPSQIPSPLNEEIGFGLMILGAIGMALKEFLGIEASSTSSTTTTTTTTTPTPTPTPTPPPAPSMYKVTIGVSEDGLYPYPQGGTTDPNGVITVLANSNITVKATPTVGYRFIQWVTNNGIATGQNPAIFNASSDGIIITANFAPKS